MKRFHGWVGALVLVTLTACAEERPEVAGAAATVTESSESVAAEPSRGEKEYAQLTASWSPEALEACGRGLKETLGTRDLVEGALAGVSDPGGKAAVEIEDARHWLDEGNRMIESVRTQLEAGSCDEKVRLALDEAVQFYVKSGTSAVQAGQIAGS